jgi:hypothetical protein
LATVDGHCHYDDRCCRRHERPEVGRVSSKADAIPRPAAVVRLVAAGCWRVLVVPTWHGSERSKDNFLFVRRNRDDDWCNDLDLGLFRAHLDFVLSLVGKYSLRPEILGQVFPDGGSIYIGIQI